MLCAGEEDGRTVSLQALAHFNLTAHGVVVPADVVATLSVRGQCVALERYERNLKR